MADAEFLIIIPSALLAAYCAIRLCSQNVDSQRRPSFHLVAWLAFGVMLGVVGLLSTLRISQSARPQIEGTISNFEVSSGRSSSSYFTVVTDQGEAVRLDCRAYGSNLQNGQRVRVQYLEEYGAVLDLEILHGPNAGWKLRESDSLSEAKFSAFAGACFAIFGLAQWAFRRHADAPQD